MTDAEKYNFEIRNNGILIIGNYKSSNQSLCPSIQNGDSANLKYEGEIILIENIKKIEIDIYEGIIKGFEPSKGLKFKELKKNSIITFNEKNIISFLSKS